MSQTRKTEVIGTTSETSVQDIGTSGLSSSAKTAIGISGSFVVLCLICALVWWCLKRTNRIPNGTTNIMSATVAGGCSKHCVNLRKLFSRTTNNSDSISVDMSTKADSEQVQFRQYYENVVLRQSPDVVPTKPRRKGKNISTASINRASKGKPDEVMTRFSEEFWRATSISEEAFEDVNSCYRPETVSPDSAHRLTSCRKPQSVHSLAAGFTNPQKPRQESYYRVALNENEETEQYCWHTLSPEMNEICQSMYGDTEKVYGDTYM